MALTLFGIEKKRSFEERFAEVWVSNGYDAIGAYLQITGKNKSINESVAASQMMQKTSTWKQIVHLCRGSDDVHKAEMVNKFDMYRYFFSSNLFDDYDQMMELGRAGNDPTEALPRLAAMFCFFELCDSKAFTRDIQQMMNLNYLKLKRLREKSAIWVIGINAMNKKLEDMGIQSSIISLIKTEV